jgi:hypothetical protein
VISDWWLVTSEKTKQLEPIRTERYIIAQMEREDSQYGSIPVVVFSNHPRFVAGTRFDYGFLHISLDEGYSVFFIGRFIPERAAIWKDGVQRDRA